jgi:MFS family permease
MPDDRRTDEGALLPHSSTGWRSRSSLAIGSASFLADAGHEVPTALLPSFLTSTLGAPAAVLGLIEGVADALAGVARLAGGALADDPARRARSAMGGYAATAVLSAGIGLATNVVQAGLLRAGAWTARGLRVPARNALLADAVAPEQFGRAYGFERAMDNLGAIAGPVLALAMVATIGARNAILVSVVPGLLAAMAIVYAVRKLPRSQWRRRQPLRLNVRPVLATRLRRLTPGIVLFEFGNIATTLLILRATELLTPERGLDGATSIALGLYVAYNAAATLASFPAGRATDLRGSLAVLIIGVVLFGASYVALAVTNASLVLLAGCFIAAGIAIGCVETAEHAAVAAYAPESIRGSAFGLLAAVQAFGNLVASSVAGALWTLASPRTAFGYAAVLTIAASVALLLAARSTVVAES